MMAAHVHVPVKPVLGPSRAVAMENRVVEEIIIKCPGVAADGSEPHITIVEQIISRSQRLFVISSCCILNVFGGDQTTLENIIGEADGAALWAASFVK